MSKRISRIAPWQAGKQFAIVYFILSLFFVIPMMLIASFAPMPPGPAHKFSAGMLVAFPFLYALAGLIFVPLGCWIYNLAAKFTGGVQVSVVDDADA
ncbi:MAG: hypothetical protein JSR67_09410 [Proteobacteria bacterium]|nr:hypothetical protein [Pseudomonadota bacterium]